MYFNFATRGRESRSRQEHVVDAGREMNRIGSGSICSNMDIVSFVAVHQNENATNWRVLEFVSDSSFDSALALCKTVGCHQENEQQKYCWKKLHSQNHVRILACFRHDCCNRAITLIHLNGPTRPSKDHPQENATASLPARSYLAKSKDPR